MLVFHDVGESPFSITIIANVSPMLASIIAEG